MSRGGALMPLGKVPMELDAHRRAALEVVGKVAARAPGEVETYLCGSCGVTPVGPRPKICDGCTKPEAMLDVEKRRAERLLIPPRFRWARLDLHPFAPEGYAGWAAHPEAVRRVRAFGHGVLVLSGGSRKGKTALACARLFAEASEGVQGVYVKCEHLSGSADDQDRARHLYRRALEARAVVLDDLGKELGGAPAETPMAAFRGERACSLIREIHDISGIGTPRRLLIVTLAPTEAGVGRSHGGDIVGRLLADACPGMETIDLDTMRGRR